MPHASVGMEKKNGKMPASEVAKTKKSQPDGECEGNAQKKDN